MFLNIKYYYNFIIVCNFILFSITKGKDRIIFVTKEDHEAPSNAELIEDDPNDPYEDHGKFLNLYKILIIILHSLA